MTRVEENKMVVAEMEKKSESIPNGTYEEVTAFQFGVIATMLTDISKSLAVIADGEESDIKQNLNYADQDTLMPAT